jgi:tripartite-type tricarboxylate transporter receptor subunit TctC
MQILGRIASALAAASLAFAAQAQVDKPVRIVVGFAPGGSADIAARLIAERMKDELKQPVLVENKPGAGGRIVAESMKSAPADGSVLMLTPVVVPVLAPMVFSKLPYDPAVDFTPVAHVANFQFALGVNGTPSGEVDEGARRLVQGQPGEGELRQPRAGQPAALLRPDDRQGRRHRPRARAVQRRRADDERPDGRPGRGGIDTTVEMIELHRAGKIRILGTSGATRSPLLPEVPTLVESGLAGVEGTGWFAVYAPAKVPEATVRQLNAAINKALAAPEVRERFTKLGLEPTGGSAADLAKRMADDTARWGPIVKASGFKAD